MAYFRQLDKEIDTLLELLSRDEQWLIVINADPDALASALALKRIMTRRVLDVGIAHVNEVTRPDNLAMIRYLRIPTQKFTTNLAVQYHRLALVDSQPHHHKDFEDLSFSLVIDHHPIVEEQPVIVDYKDIQPYGSNSTIMTEYLYNLKIKPGQLLATALLYGIKTDTCSFERSFCDEDVRAFRHLTKFANPDLLRKIVRSEFHLEWLSYFSLALRRLRLIGRGAFVYVDEVENPDVLVILADFLMRVQQISWTVVGGTYDDGVVAIFRGDGISRDMGAVASNLFGELGSAGGHKAMARAEFPLKQCGKKNPEEFLWKKISRGKKTDSGLITTKPHSSFSLP